MRIRWSIFGLLLGGWAGTRASAQTNPEDVARAFFKAESEGRWTDAARLLDLKTFQWILQQSLAAPPAIVPTRTAEELMRLDPRMPRAVAEYQVEQINRYRDYNFLAYEYARVESKETLAKLSVEEAAARWLQARSPEWQQELSLREATKRGDNLCGKLPDSIKKIVMADARMPTARILGSTTRDSAAYVLVSAEYHRRPSVGSERGLEPSPSVLQLAREGDAWRVIPAFDMPNAMGHGGSTSFVTGCGAVRDDKNANK